MHQQLGLQGRFTLGELDPDMKDGSKKYAIITPDGTQTIVTFTLSFFFHRGLIPELKRQVDAGLKKARETREK